MALIRNNAIRDDDVITPVGGIPGPAPAPKPVPPGDVILPVGGVPGPAPAPGPDGQCRALDPRSARREPDTRPASLPDLAP